MRRFHTFYLITGFILLAVLFCGCAETSTVSTPNPTTDAPTPTVATDTPESEINADLSQYFEGFNGAFVLYELNRDQYTRYNPERCAERFLPASTFKILNSLIALETGIIPDEETVIEWDGAEYEIESWNQDHTLRTAIRDSVVWYYQELARRIGSERMQHYVEAAGYGNQDISGNIDSFWLDGGLRISANEQIEFLQRFYQDELPFSARSMGIVKDILVLEETDTYRLSGKTGSTQRVPLHTGWFVGYLETGGDVYFFATNIESTDPDGIANGETARRINRGILEGLGLLR